MPIFAIYDSIGFLHTVGDALGPINRHITACITLKI